MEKRKIFTAAAKHGQLLMDKEFACTIFPAFASPCPPEQKKIYCGMSKGHVPRWLFVGSYFTCRTV